MNDLTAINKCLFLVIISTLANLNTCLAQDQRKADSLISILDELPDSLRVQNLIEIARRSSSPDIRIQYAIMALEELEDEKVSYLKSKAYHWIGVAYRKKGDLEKGLTHLFKAANMDHLLSDSTGLAKDYSEIATCYARLNDVQNSLQYYSRAIALLRKTRDKSLRIVLLNTGYRYYEVGKYDTALMYYDEAEPLFRKEKSDIGLAYTIGNRALVKWKTGHINTAIKDLKTAIELLEPLGDAFGMADYHNQLGTIYLEIGDRENASYHLTTGIKMAAAVDLKEQVRDASKMLSQLYHKANNADSAYHYLHQYISTRDSIANEETIKALANQRADFEISQKQSELDLINQQKKNRQILAISFGGVALLSLVFLAFYYRAYLKRKRLALKLENLNATKDKFFSIVSHDLRGPVGEFNGIGMLIKEFLKEKSYDELAEISEHIDKSAQSLSELLDNLLSWAVQQQGQIPYKPTSLDLNELVDTTIAIFEAKARAKNITLYSAINERVRIEGDRDTTMTILRNLVGNALKFTPPNGKVWMTASYTEDKVEIQIHDTGLGMSEEQITRLFQLGGAAKRSFGTEGETGLGIGLQLVKEFVSLNRGTLEVKSKEGKGSVFGVSMNPAKVA